MTGPTISMPRFPWRVVGQGQSQNMPAVIDEWRLCDHSAGCQAEWEDDTYFITAALCARELELHCDVIGYPMPAS